MSAARDALRPDLQVIFDQLPEGAKLLDIGCGRGDLLCALRDEKGVDGRGMELDPTKVADAVARGLSVVQGDADGDLADYMSDGYDYVLMSQTLGALERPDIAFDHLLRIGKAAFVTFPNFAHWRVRMSLMFGGRMPVTRLLPERWYDTPNIHHVTVDDFRAFADERGAKVEESWFISGEKTIGPSFANLRAETGVFLLRRQAAR